MISHIHLTDRPPRTHRTHHVYSGATIDVAQGREIAALCRRRPYEGDFTIIHLTAAHRVSANVWNILLKPIEEPPEFVTFHVYAPSLDALPRTIKTRCHVTREQLPQPYQEDVTRLMRLCESREAMLILREGDRATDHNETLRLMDAMWDACLKQGKLKAAALCQAHIENLRLGSSPRISMKSLLLAVALA